jgi:hypothetical protein
MRFRFPLALAGCAFLTAGLADAAPPVWRIVTTTTGAKQEVAFDGITEDGSYKLRRRSDQKVFEVRPDLLQEADRTFFDAAANAVNEEIEKLNVTAGHPIFSKASFDKRPAEEIVKALRLREESSTKYLKSWRLYPGDDYQLFGARPFSISMHADAEGMPAGLSAVFANKGDFGSKAGVAEGHFEGGTAATETGIKKAIAADEAAIEKAISGILGPAVTQRFGEGKARTTIKRWDWNGQSLLLSSEETEYVSLQIVPLDIAEAGGRTARINSEVIRKQRKDSVVRSENGDVYITEIPMVDQGPKGYCVPATFERAMRTMGIEADMYLLAMVGGTKIGGGTNVAQLLNSVRSSVYRKGGRTKDETAKDLRIRDVKRYIDEGIPVMWTMMALDPYLKIADLNTAKRANVTDWTAYAAEVAAQSAEFAKLEKGNDRHHICMIIGYNEKTDEFAVSDSWGPSFERRWVPVKVANWVNHGDLFMILP